MLEKSKAASVTSTMLRESLILKGIPVKAVEIGLKSNSPDYYILVQFHKILDGPGSIENPAPVDFSPEDIPGFVGGIVKEFTALYKEYFEQL